MAIAKCFFAILDNQGVPIGVTEANCQSRNEFLRTTVAKDVLVDFNRSFYTEMIFLMSIFI